MLGTNCMRDAIAQLNIPQVQQVNMLEEITFTNAMNKYMENEIVQLKPIE